MPCFPKKDVYPTLNIQTVLTQISLILNEQSDQGLHCLPYQLYILHISSGFPHNLLKFSVESVIVTKYFG